MSLIETISYLGSICELFAYFFFYVATQSAQRRTANNTFSSFLQSCVSEPNIVVANIVVAVFVVDVTRSTHRISCLY
jgi:hypothetical protein